MRLIKDSMVRKESFLEDDCYIVDALPILLMYCIYLEKIPMI